MAGNDDDRTIRSMVGVSNFVRSKDQPSTLTNCVTRKSEPLAPDASHYKAKHSLNQQKNAVRLYAIAFKSADACNNTKS